jgi:hypothetical protein
VRENEGHRQSARVRDMGQVREIQRGLVVDVDVRAQVRLAASEGGYGPLFLGFEG